jgi:hypothetical protein
VDAVTAPLGDVTPLAPPMPMFRIHLVASTGGTREISPRPPDAPPCEALTDNERESRRFAEEINELIRSRRSP